MVKHIGVHVSYCYDAEVIPVYILSNNNGPLTQFVALPSEQTSQSDEYMINGRDEILHLRSYVPAEGETIKALVIFIHG